ncbi:leucine-rich repeat flightless-interacting protein 2 isoform X2 [Cimex lectularius]|uniref:Leucine-rich repeat flightless-interacting protein 2 n=1 Tax=Cimex lectularius TaxID=79782 RepID=A0A8I6RWI7_CIMLE|nr:leucine-rich repeat flightless-interacting protein 2 isoform X2 [Cimex lectularius]
MTEEETGGRFVSIVDVTSESGCLSDGSAESGVCLDGDGVTIIRLGETQSSSEDEGGIVDFLGKSGDDAEARLAAKRQARAEAREIRMRELERQQKESDENADRIYDMYPSTPDGITRSARVSATLNNSRLSASNSYQSSRRSSEDSLEENTSLRDVRGELREVEDKFRRAMIGNAQLDNEKAAAAYQVELYKDRYEELEEEHNQLQREHKEKCRQLEQNKRDQAKLQKDLEAALAALQERDRLIEEQGLVIVGGETSSSATESDEEDDAGGGERKGREKHRKALVSSDMAKLLDSVGHGSLDVRLKKLAAERNELQDELRHVKLELEEEKSKNSRFGSNPADIEELQREANKQLGDYKFKLQKAEQDVSTLQATVARLEGQVMRYKTAAEAAEKVEDELKLERRKLQRELREFQAKVEELETSNNHLQKRLDKLKTAKSALLKDL